MLPKWMKLTNKTAQMSNPFAQILLESVQDGIETSAHTRKKDGDSTTISGIASSGAKLLFIMGEEDARRQRAAERKASKAERRLEAESKQGKRKLVIQTGRGACRGLSSPRPSFRRRARKSAQIIKAKQHKKKTEWVGVD